MGIIQHKAEKCWECGKPTENRIRIADCFNGTVPLHKKCYKPLPAAKS